MKSFFSFSLLFISFYLLGQQQTVSHTITPENFNETDEITIRFTNVDVNLWSVSDLYFWSWSLDDKGLNAEDAPNNGTWTNSNEAHKLTSNSDGSFSITLVPATFYNRTAIGSIGFLIKAKDGTGDKKSQDMYAEVNIDDSIGVPVVTEAPLPNGAKDGLTILDDNTALFVLYAPQKEFINLIGSFNNWERDDNNYLLKKDSTKDRFWIQLNNLSPTSEYTYQYLVDGSLRVADPYSTTILDESNDPYINTTTYPNLPSYPVGQTTHAVSYFITNEASYNWTVTDFSRPDKQDLVIYELLIRDFDELHSFDAVKDRLPYLKTLGINAIELMPVNEFDGNESWGYNPSFHMALDKYYGTKNAFKQFIDACHQEGIAVILDVVYNHATGQHPFYRLWNTSNGGYGGQATADNPFFNATAKHTYNVFNDFNHTQDATKTYVKQTAQYWIEEFKIDGFRWDLTKGFTQNCSETDETCTNAYQADRVAILKEYADYQWDIDPNFYVIFEHLGTNDEETEWATYRLDEGKGILLWSNLNHNYNEATMGYHNSSSSDFSWASYKNRNWSYPSNITYMESHDEERLMFKNLEYGNTSGTYTIKALETALDRMSMAGAFYFLIPGPKMIWQFGELGYDISIEENGRTGNKPILWDYYNENNRKALYDNWAKLIAFKTQEAIFKTSNFTLDVDNSNGIKKIHLTNDITSDNLQYLTVIGNFGTTTQTVNPEFQTIGTWYDFFSNTPITVSDVNTEMSLAPGEYHIYSNTQVTLSNNNYIHQNNTFTVYPNPTDSYFSINTEIKNLKIFDITGKKVKEFNHNYNTQTTFDISDLPKGIYVIRGNHLNIPFQERLIIH